MSGLIKFKTDYPGIFFKWGDRQMCTPQELSKSRKHIRLGFLSNFLKLAALSQVFLASVHSTAALADCDGATISRMIGVGFTRDEILKLCGSSTAASVAADPLKVGLVGYWPLDNDTANWTTNITQDVSGNGNNGMLVNMSTTTSPVPGGTALSFDGSSSYVNLGSNSSLNITNQITVSAWVRVTAFTRFIRFVAKGRDTCESPYVDVVLGTSDQTYRTNDTMPRWTVAINGVQQEIVSTNTPLSAGVWYHLVGTYNGSASILYVNGAQVGAISSLTGTVDSFPSNPFSLGQELNGCTSDPYFNGAIHNMRIYNRALSAQEVVLLYSMGQ